MFNKGFEKKWIDIVLLFLCFILPFYFYRDVIFQNKIMVFGDGITFFVSKLFQFAAIKSGELPLWNSYVISGMPLISDPNNSYFYPFHFIGLILPAILYSNIYYLLHLGLAGLFTFLFLKKVTKDKILAFSGAIIFSSCIAIGGARKEHGWVYTAITWFPLVLFFIESYIQTNKKKFLLFSSFFMAIQFFGGHPQQVLYSDIFAFLYLLYFSFLNRVSSRQIIFSLLIWIGTYLLFSAIAMIPMAELIIFSSRANVSQIFCLFSSRWELLLMTIFPYVFGPDTAHPFGRQGSAEISIELYLGIIPLIYALYAISHQISNKFVRFAAISIILSFFYSSSCNTPLLGELIQKIPILNFFRVQSRILYIYSFFSICCFAFGIAEIRKPEKIFRIFIFGLISLGAIILTAAAVSILSPINLIPGYDPSIFAERNNIYIISIAIGIVNCCFTGFLFFTKNRGKNYNLLSLITIFVLLAISLWDAGRFSWLHPEYTFDSFLKTVEVDKINALLKNDPFRIMTQYNDYSDPSYVNSGLLNNWSMVNKIRNLKGRTEFENPQLNEILGQVESRGNRNSNRLIEDGHLLSMLSVKYVLIPAELPNPEKISPEVDQDLIDHKQQIKFPGNGKLFVVSLPIKLIKDRYYRIDFNLNIANSENPLFYVDFYGGAEYDLEEQQQVIALEKGVHRYSTTLFSGKKEIPSEVSIRFVSTSNSQFAMQNLKVIQLMPATENLDYILVSQTKNYNIYENLLAQKLIYIPDEVKTIWDEAELRKFPDFYPELDRISYIKSYKNFLTSGNLEIISVKNNSISARVISDKPTFVNHSESFYPGWKAYVDGVPTKIYLVNGVIQGVEVPPGNHIVEFIYDPLSLKAGAIISGSSFIFLIFILLRNRKLEFSKIMININEN